MTAPDKDLPGWDGVCRRDGLLVMKSFDSRWVVLPRDDRLAIDVCPHCGAFFREQRQAQRAADSIYPLREALP